MKFLKVLSGNCCVLWIRISCICVALIGVHEAPPPPCYERSTWQWHGPLCDLLLPHRSDLCRVFYFHSRATKWQQQGGKWLNSFLQVDRFFSCPHVCRVPASLDEQIVAKGIIFSVILLSHTTTPGALFGLENMVDLTYLEG